MTQKSIRLWLEKNKVFFEIFSSVLLGTAGIFVAYASYQVSEAQLKVSRVGTEPHFYVKNILFRDPEAERFEEKELYLHNAGAPAHNISTNVRSFIEVNLYEPNSRSVIIPIVGYFSSTLSTNSPTGLIATFRGHLNNHHATKLHFSTLDPEVMKGRSYFDHEIFSIVEVFYKNTLNEERQIYFRNTSQVSPETAQQLLRLWNEKIPLELTTMTVDSLMAAVNNQEKL